jgi:integrase
MKQHKIVNGRWVVRSMFRRLGRWRVRVRDLKTGKVRELSTRERERRRADQRILDWIRQFERREEGGMQGERFDRAYEERLSLKDVRPSTLADNKRTFKAIYTPRFGDQLVHEIELKDIEQFLKWLRTDRKVSVRTQRKYLSELRSFFQWARRRQYCTSDPTEGIKLGRPAKWQGVALTLEQARKLLVACRDPIVRQVTYTNRASAEQKFQPPEHLLVAVLIALHAGFRRGNITRLRWRQIDLGERKITIAADEMKANTEHVMPIHPELAEVLRGLLHGHDRIDLDAPVLGGEFSEIRKSFKSALKRAELPDVRWHDLRHTAATWWGERCTHAVLQHLLGHSPGSISLHYVHIPFATLRDVVDAMPRLLAEPSVSSDNHEHAKEAPLAPVETTQVFGDSGSPRWGKPRRRLQSTHQSR